MTHLDLPGSLLLAGAALLAGAINAVAGGGTLLSFPTLLLLGVPPLTANVSNTIGLLPGYGGGSAGYRHELSGQGTRVRALAAVSTLGAVAGALLLMRTPASVFSGLVPWLILLSCALLAVQSLAASRVPAEGGRALRVTLLGGQLGAAVYGAFFGAGLGVLTLALLGLCIRDTLQRLNALKGAASLVVNAVAAAVFALLAPVSWAAVAIMMPASFAGGFAGVAVARRLNASVLRVLVIAVGVAVAVRLLL